MVRAPPPSISTSSTRCSTPRCGPKDDEALWSATLRAGGALAGALLRDGVAVVVVEGDVLSEAQRRQLLDAVGVACRPTCVTLRLPVDVALRRIADDPSRGLSRDPAFLRAHYAGLEAELAARPVSDLVVDTRTTPAAEAAAAIVERALSGD